MAAICSKTEREVTQHGIRQPFNKPFVPFMVQNVVDAGGNNEWLEGVFSGSTKIKKLMNINVWHHFGIANKPREAVRCSTKMIPEKCWSSRVLMCASVHRLSIEYDISAASLSHPFSLRTVTSVLAFGACPRFLT